MKRLNQSIYLSGPREVYDKWMIYESIWFIKQKVNITKVHLQHRSSHYAWMRHLYVQIFNDMT